MNGKRNRGEKNKRTQDISEGDEIRKEERIKKERTGDDRKGSPAEGLGGGCHTGLIDSSITTELSHSNPVFNIEKNNIRRGIL